MPNINTNTTQEILDIFYHLTTIPHGSKNTNEMANFIEIFAKEHGYEVRLDSVGNILAFKTNTQPKVCYQSHYDMVCVGVAEQKLALNLIKEKKVKNGITQTWLKAKDSSLGADNGVGVAIMLYFIKKNVDAEFLFTNDEEIGMIGAKGLEIPIKSNIIINLDSEVLGEITIGCAGGFDLLYKNEFETTDILPNWYYYTLQSKNFAGGHSGLDINNSEFKHQNAILESIKFLHDIIKQNKDSISIDIINWQGGEKRNSIPMNSKIVFACKEKIIAQSNNFFTINELKELPNELLDKTNEIFLQTPKGVDFSIFYSLLTNIKIGVIDTEDSNVQNSLNLSNISFANGKLSLAFMGRANTHALLSSNLDNLKCYLSKRLESQKQDKASIEVNEYYSPWEKQSTDSYDELQSFLTNAIKNKDILKQETQNFNNILYMMYESMYDVVDKFNIKPKIVELHAGLECGILLSKLNQLGSKDIVALSIGPSIRSPHSIREEVWIESAGAVVQILYSFMDKIQ